MVLTHSMATANDIQEEEPPTTALKKQVKTLAAAVERLTRQNCDLEKQLRQKNATLDNQGTDQEGTSTDRRNQEGPQASNAPSKPERQNVPHRYDSTAYYHRDTGDEGTNGGYDERSQGASVR